MGGGAINIHFFRDQRIVSGGVVFLVCVSLSCGAAATWIDDTTGEEHHISADLTETFDAFNVPLDVWRRKVRQTVRLASTPMPGEGFEDAFTKIWGATALANLQALDGEDETRPATSRVYAALHARYLAEDYSL